jgi:ornithine carbamoyltransferase
MNLNLAGRDLLKLSDLSPAELAALLAQAAELKRDPYRADLRGRVLGLLFQKASTRTRVSFTVAMAQRGAAPWTWCQRQCK